MKNNLQYKAHHRVFLVLAILFVALILTPFVSGFNFDNVKDYDEATRTATITNAFGLGAEIAEVKLISEPHTIVVLNGGSCVSYNPETQIGYDCQVAEFQIDNKDIYSDVFNNLEFYDINSNMQKYNSRQYTYKYKVISGYEDVNVYEQVCEKLGVNGSLICENKLVGTEEKEIVNWVEINNKEMELTKGNITIGVFTNVHEGEHTEWIPTLFGVRINEWSDFGTAILKERIEDARDSSSAIDDNNLRGFNFEPGITGPDGTFTISGFEVMLKDANTGVCGTINATLWTVDASNEPNGTVVANTSITCDGEVSTADWNWFNISLPGSYEISEGTNYSLQISTIGGAGSQLTIGTTTSSNYTGYFVYSTNAGVGWNTAAGTGEIPVFRTWGSETVSVISSQSFPANNTEQVNTTIIVECNDTSNGGAILESSLVEVLFPNGTLEASSLLPVSATNSTQHTINGLTTEYTYDWNCFVNETTGIDNYRTGNRSITISGISEDTQTFNATTIETSSESFIANMTFDTSLYSLITARLYYNYTWYTGTVDTTGGTSTIYKTLNAPSVTEDTAINFNWEVIGTGATTTLTKNLTGQTQTVSPIIMYFCNSSSNQSYLNITAYDEETLSLLNVSIGITFNYGAVGSSTRSDFAYSNTSEELSNFDFCFEPSNQNYLIDAVIEASASNYETEYYTIDDLTLSSTTETFYNISLLNSGNSTSFIIYVRDSSFSSVANAIVHVQRYYPSINQWITTEVVTTNNEGKALAHFETEDVSYRFLVYVDGVLELTSSSTKIFCEASPCTITLTLPGTGEFAAFGGLTNLTSSLTFSSATEVFTYTYEDTSDTFESGRLWVVRESLGNITSTTICNVTSSNTADVLTCDISGQINGTYIARSYIDRTGEDEDLVHLLIHYKSINIISTIGTDGLIWGFFILVGIVMLGLWKPTVAIIFTVISFILMSLLHLVSISIITIASIVIIGGILLWQMRK